VVVRNDSPCGTTIGPMSSAGTGVRTVGMARSRWM
jgi:aspartyl aminopeptidase